MWLYINVSKKFGYRFYLDGFGLVWSFFFIHFHILKSLMERKKKKKLLWMCTKWKTQMCLRWFRYILISTKWILYFCLICWAHTHTHTHQPFRILFFFFFSFTLARSGFRMAHFSWFKEKKIVRFVFCVCSGSFSTHWHLYYSKINGFKHQLSGIKSYYYVWCKRNKNNSNKCYERGRERHAKKTTLDFFAGEQTDETNIYVSVCVV